MRVTVYVLSSLDIKKRYVGITSDLTRRIREHTSGSTKAGQLLGRFTVLHTEVFPTYKEARAREKHLKSGAGREWLNQEYPRSRPAYGG